MKDYLDPEDDAGTVFAQAMLLFFAATYFLIMAIAKALGVK